MQQIEVKWIDGRAMVPVYDVVDYIKNVLGIMKVDALDEIQHGENHMSYVTGTIDGMEIVVEWLEDVAAAQL